MCYNKIIELFWLIVNLHPILYEGEGERKEEGESERECNGKYFQKNMNNLCTVSIPQYLGLVDVELGSFFDVHVVVANLLKHHGRIFC